MAACLAAGLEGIREKIEPPVCMERMTEKEREECETLPRTLYEAVKRFKNDEFLQSVIGNHISRHLIHTKDAEWNEYCKQVSEWEMERYLGNL